MKLKDIVENLGMRVETAQKALDQEVTGGYVSDLLSDVMAHSKPGDVWITLQVHPNIIAVATLKDLAGIIIVQGRKPDEETIEKAKSENIPILVSELHAFEVVGRLYQMGISGMR
jgi:predicted membrane-bound dolichyl-phosphate-mannose-protein mannosyltransferase